MRNNIKFQKLNPSAILPTRGSSNAVGLDVYSAEEVILRSDQRVAVKTGLAVEIPSGCYGRIAPRSGLALRNGVDVLAGVIDPDYRGEVLCLLVNFGTQDFKVAVGDRIAQLIVEKVAFLTPEWSNVLIETQRDQAGFGSTGK